MSEARSQILGGIRRSLSRGPLDATGAAPLEARLAAHKTGLIPARSADRDQAGLVDLFEDYAKQVNCTVARVASLDAIPEALATYLAGQNLPAEITAAPHPLLDQVDWSKRPLLKLRRGKADGKEAVGLSVSFTAIAETGTLMLASGADSPSTLNFLPDTHVVVLKASSVAGSMEGAWAKLRETYGSADGTTQMPRTVNFITGPSRTGDIEQKIVMGAHGPRRLHIILLEG
jgi:L-lactate dehydrogenase complex protein LldG